MSGISVGIAVLLIKGIPECLIVAWAIHVFTNTPVEPKKYFLLAGIYILTTYLIRLLPITLGINTVLSLFVLIFAFQIIHKAGLAKVIRAIISSVIILILTAFSEVFNVLLLSALYGREQAESLFTSPDGLTRAINATPSNVFLALFVLAGYLLIKFYQKKKAIKHGEDGSQTSEQNSDSTGV